MKPDAALLDGLRRSRLLPLWARGSVGVGERRSTSKGSGMEFADYRAYRPGDDLRHLDPHLHARLGENFVRQYVVQRQLQVTILIDGSRSMSAGSGDRGGLAGGLAAVLGYVGLVGGDEVRYGFGRAGSIEWSPRFRGLSAASRAFAWLSRKRSDAGTFAGCLASASRALAQPGLVIVISDFWDVSDDDMRSLAARGQEVWACHLPAPEELEPALLGEGEARLVDSETGEEVDLQLSRAVLEQWRRLGSRWRDDLRQRCEALRGRYVLVRADRPLPALLLTDWRRLGLLQ